MASPLLTVSTAYRMPPRTTATQAHPDTTYFQAQLQTAVEASQAMGYRGLHMELAVHGACIDCANTGTP